MGPIAHVFKNPDGKWKTHSLEEHLVEVGRLAGQFAEPFGNKDWAHLAGLWHDLGKYSPEFQAYIKSQSGFDPDAHLEGVPGKVNHSSAGALHAVERFGKLGRILAYLIAGHHTGLLDWHTIVETQGPRGLNYRLGNNEKIHLENACSGSPPLEILNHPVPSSSPPKGGDPALWIRILFSCLVDADFLDTEAFMNPERTEARQSFPDLPELLPKFQTHMEDFQAKANPTDVNHLRREILERCIQQAIRPSGIYSLTVPTGGGKTLSSLAFALHHAKAHGKQRVIYVLPYTSIIEQTAAVFRGIFGEIVLEHHSNLDANRETPQTRVACENWDAPLIVTTSVQFFESLFSHRTSRVRKLHNLVNSIVILDEVQLLPPGYLNPILKTMQELSDNYKVTVLLSTATQPALSPRKTFEGSFPGLKSEELMEDPHALHSALKRVKVELPPDPNQSQTWEEIAEELKAHSTVLCIVNRRDDCRELYRLMPHGTIHLSALMCGKHRREIIEDIKSLLKNEQPVRVISTQLVEAGVDFDFPVVYRAMAGLDSIAQAAGRCNREGKLDQGRVVVFVPPKPAPPGLLRKAEQTARQLILQGLDDPLEPDLFQKYFETLYWQVGNLDEKRILEDLKPGEGLEIQFRTASQKFRLIDETQYRPVVVQYDETSRKLIHQLQQPHFSGPNRDFMRKLQQYVITVPERIHSELLNRYAIREVHPGVFIQLDTTLYDSKTGFLDKKGISNPEDFTI